LALRGIHWTDTSGGPEPTFLQSLQQTIAGNGHQSDRNSCEIIAGSCLMTLGLVLSSSRVNELQQQDLAQLQE
jgi:hypothetical protein